MKELKTSFPNQEKIIRISKIKYRKPRQVKFQEISSYRKSDKVLINFPDENNCLPIIIGRIDSFQKIRNVTYVVLYSCIIYSIRKEKSQRIKKDFLIFPYTLLRNSGINLSSPNKESRFIREKIPSLDPEIPVSNRTLSLRYIFPNLFRPEKIEKTPLEIKVEKKEAQYSNDTNRIIAYLISMLRNSYYTKKQYNNLYRRIYDKDFRKLILSVIDYKI